MHSSCIQHKECIYTSLFLLQFVLNVHNICFDATVNKYYVPVNFIMNMLSIDLMTHGEEKHLISSKFSQLLTLTNFQNIIIFLSVTEIFHF
jgi:hypothetical protein